jgi:hypothetical protein
MKPGELDITPYLEKLNQLSKIALVDMQDLMRQEAALFVFNGGKIPGIINITPPFSAKDPGGRSALFAGRIKINQDLAAVFQPVKLKGHREISTVFGHKLSTPVKVPTRERHPDVSGIYKQRRDRKNSTGRKIMGRGQRAPYYVDRAKLESIRKAAHARIGFAAAAWYQAAMQCSPPLALKGVPDWVKKHSDVPGVGRITPTEHGIRIELSSSLSYNTALDMQGKATRVLGYRQSALERRLPHALAAAAKKANTA